MMTRTLTLISATALLAAACGGPAEDTETTAPAETADTRPADEGGTDVASAPEEADSEAAPQTILEPGHYCYFRDAADVTEALDLTVAGDGTMTGENYGVIHQESASYYASFTIDMTEAAVGETGLVTFDTVTEVDGDTQYGQMIWDLSEDSAAPDGLNDPLQSADCESLEDRVYGTPEE